MQEFRGPATYFTGRGGVASRNEMHAETGLWARFIAPIVHDEFNQISQMSGHFEPEGFALMRDGSPERSDFYELFYYGSLGGGFKKERKVDREEGRGGR